jgi:hypothetical protein
MSDVTATAKYTEFVLGIIHSLFKCKLKFRGSCFNSLPWYRFRLMNICILITNIKFALSTFNVSLPTSFRIYQQTRTINCNSSNLTLTHVEYWWPELTPSAILLCVHSYEYLYVFPQLIKLLLYTETSCYISCTHVTKPRNHHAYSTLTHTQYLLLDRCTNIPIDKIPEPHLNLLKRSDYLMYHKLRRSEILHGAHIAFLCCVRTSEQTAIFTSNTKRLITWNWRIYWAVCAASLRHVSSCNGLVLYSPCMASN